jgi:hypothetical protein
MYCNWKSLLSVVRDAGETFVKTVTSVETNAGIPAFAG